MPIFDFRVARDGEMHSALYEADDEEAAQWLAVADVSRVWRTSYPDFDDLVADCDGVALDRSERLALCRALTDRLKTMIDEGRVNPCDRTWLTETLVAIAAAAN